MGQILVTIDDTQPSASIRNAIKMLRGVVSASIIKESPLTIEEKQKAYVKESLSRALQEVKLAKLQGEKLQDVDEMLRGVVSASIIKESPLTIEEKQKAYVKESLSRALQEVKLAKLQGEKLQDVDDFIWEMKDA